MSLFKFKPTSSGVRGKIKIVNTLYKKQPLKKYLRNITFNSGRNNRGCITVRHKGGRMKRFYRYIDFFRNKDNILGIVERFEYDPNRNCSISLILYSDGERRYIISPKNLNIGDKIFSGNHSFIKIGNNLFLKDIPIGTRVHCVETRPMSGGKIARSAGSYCIVVSKNIKTSTLLTKSGSKLQINNMCRATIGEVGNSDYMYTVLGKAGANRLRGVRPTVRGVAMNPFDHPHGGGEGKTSGGRDPVSP